MEPDGLDEYRRKVDRLLTGARWRVGRKVGRTIYAQLGDEPADSDPLIGTMDTPMLAMEAVRGHNERLTHKREAFRRLFSSVDRAER